MADLSNPFIKSISINDLPEEAWTYLSGQSEQSEDLQKHYQSVPWLFRGVDIRANAVLSMPFSIYKGDTEIDNSNDYQNVIGFLPNPGALFGLVEAALVIWGYAYAFKARNAFMTKGVRYMLPTSIVPNINAESGEITFKRKVGGQTLDLTTDDIVYWWKQDPFIELGEPQSSPARAAAAAAGVSLNVDNFAAAFFERGAIKATLLTTTNVLPSDKEALKSAWARMFKGISKAWQTFIVNADAVKPVVIGEGLESLENSNLTESKRVDISVALGVPFSILFSGAATGLGGGGVAEQDDLHLYSKTIVPECRFIEHAINEQLMIPNGYRLAFTEENLDIYQEDETKRATSLVQMITALEKPEEFLIAASILGYEIEDDIRAEIEASIARKEQQRQDMLAAQQQKQEAFAAQANQTMPRNSPVVAQDKQPPPNARSIDLEKWQAKAIKRLKSGRGMTFSFTSDCIDPVTLAAVSVQLEAAKDEAAVKAIFSDAFIGYP